MGGLRCSWVAQGIVRGNHESLCMISVSHVIFFEVCEQNMQTKVSHLLLGHETSLDGTDHDKDDRNTVLPPVTRPKKVTYPGLPKKSKINGND